MKKIIALAVSLVIALSVSAEFKEGDILWQMSKSKQSPLIQLATLSPWSHCGVVVEKNKKLYVLEASNVVKLTPLQKWIAKGRLKQYKQRRVFRKAVKIRYKQYLGMPYDLAFKFGNGKMYCSELVYDSRALKRNCDDLYYPFVYVRAISLYKVSCESPLEWLHEAHIT